MSDSKKLKEGKLLNFPHSRVRMGSGPVKDLGLTALSRQFEASGKSAKGHWCSRCQGVWYSYFLESECPVCGNRHG